MSLSAEAKEIAAKWDLLPKGLREAIQARMAQVDHFPGPPRDVGPIPRVDRVLGVLHLAREATGTGRDVNVHDASHIDCSLWLAIDELQQLRNDLEGLGHV